MHMLPRLTALQRIRIGYGLLLLVFSLFVVRLFYLQIIRHDYYSNAANTAQLKEYEIEPERGIIAAQNGEQVVPIVLNEVKYTVFADPKYIDDVDGSAEKIAEVLGGTASDYTDSLRLDTRYSILAKKQSEEVSKRIRDLKLKGVGTREAVYRTYPQGSLASQLLGFVNDEGEGRYGVEEALDEKLQGKPGLVKAITDARGIPLAANKDNTLISPVPGAKTVLTIDLPLQQQVEDILKQGVIDSNAPSGGVVIMEVATGKIKAMANYPTYDPSKLNEVPADGFDVFQNNVVSSPLEVGSIMKPLTMAAALDQGVINSNTTYNDPYRFTIDGSPITNVPGSGGAGVKSLGDILQLSLNTGATWLLMQMGGGEINSQARNAWHDYMTNHYQFGKPTGVEQGYEAAGVIPDPDEGFGLNIRYANAAFGQGMTATPLQMAAVYTSIFNGGTYYRPQLVDYYEDQAGNITEVAPEILHQQTVKPEVGSTITGLMEYVYSKNHQVYGMPQLRDSYAIGSKTGTAQVANPAGGYYEDRDNGMFAGYVGGDSPEYVVIVRVDIPKIAGYAGSKAAGPIFVRLADVLIDNFGVSPKTQ